MRKSYYNSWQWRAVLHERERAAREAEGTAPPPANAGRPATRVPPDIIRRIISLHESAHAVASLATGGTVFEITVGVEADGSTRGRFWPTDPNAPRPANGPTRTEIDEAMATIVGGREVEIPQIVVDDLTMWLAPAAMERGLGVPNWRHHASDDLRWAMERAEAVTPNKLAAQQLLDRAMLRASAIVDLHREKIFLLGSALARSAAGRLGADEIHRIVDPINANDPRVGVGGAAVFATRAAMAA